MELDFGQVLIRIILAMVIGALIGAERESIQKPAGLRTHMLVCVGAAVVMLTGYYCFQTFGGNDPTRMAAQVVSGIGFLGAGTIIREGFSVRGLTTAASLWAVASLGLAVGAGFYKVSIIGAAAIYFTLSVFERLESHINRRHSRSYVELFCTDANTVMASINALMEEHRFRAVDIKISEGGRKGKKEGYNISFVIKSDHTAKNDIHPGNLIAQMKAMEGVSDILIEEL